METIVFIIALMGFIYLIYNEISTYIYNVEQWWIALPLQDKYELINTYLDRTDKIYQITRSEKIFLFKQYNKQ